MSDAELAGRVLEAARAAGAGAADVMVLSDTALSIEVRGGALERAERAESVEIGLRVLIGGRQACVAGSVLTPEAIATMAERAVAMAREAPEDNALGLADADALSAVRDAEGLELDDPAPEPSPAELEDAARAAEAAARAVRGVSQVQDAGADWGRRRTWLAASNGFAGGFARTSASISAVAISGEGTTMERDWCGEGRTFRADLPAPETVGRIAGERAAARAGARKPPTGAVPVLYDERVAGSLIGHLLAAVNGQAVVRGASWLRDALGQRVLPAALDLRAVPHLPRNPGARPFDAEGLRTAPRAIVEGGVLAGWTLDLATARRLGMESTASAVRGPASPPAPGDGAVTLSPGRTDAAGLIAEMGRGLYVTSLMGASINPTSGDYSRGAAGFWIEGGQIAWPVNECTIAGNLRAMLATIVPGNDARAHRALAIPSLLVEGLVVAGA